MKNAQDVLIPSFLIHRVLFVTKLSECINSLIIHGQNKLLLSSCIHFMCHLLLISHTYFASHSSQLKYILAFVSLIKHHDSLESFSSLGLFLQDLEITGQIKVSVPENRTRNRSECEQVLAIKT